MAVTSAIKNKIKNLNDCRQSTDVCTDVMVDSMQMC